ncbi:MAG TPA: carbohydrate binding family 9 domain-containing protein, partial [Gemmatimonadaceae bacterium]
MRARTLVVHIGCLGAALFVAAAGMRAQGIGSGSSSAARRVVSARRADSGLVRSPIIVDGRLDDAAWQNAEPSVNFVQQRPTPGAPGAQRTEARVWLDGVSLYVGLRLSDAAPDSIVAPIARRDADVYSDWALVLIDSYNDGRTAFQFAVNPRGVQRDAQITNDEEWMQDFGWNAVWQAETSRDSLGWTAEFRIPLSQLRFANSEKAVTRWGIQFGRHLARRNERTYWSPVLPDRPGFVSQFGILADVSIPQIATRRFELVPYSLAKMTTRTVDPEDPLARAREPRATLGADV